MSVFQDNSLNVDNPQSREEDEELEEQRRRQEELADLLADGIHAFNYDDSTMNSSVTSVEANEPNYQGSLRNKNEFKYEASGKSLLNDVTDNSAIEQCYKDANQQEQLKILYDVRVREINRLQKEFDKYKEEKIKEIGILKNKATLAEAEIRHLQISLTNSESLLVEKNQIINNLKQDLVLKDTNIESFKKILEEQNLEICTYKSTINELQLKLADNNPFSTGARKANSEELQKAHQDQIISLETLYQEQSKKVQILEKEKVRLEEDLKKLMKSKNEVEEENNMTIMALSKKLQNAQQQCKDLFVLGEAIKKESDHFKDRLQQLEVNKLDVTDVFQIKKMDKESMMVHMEKLRRMLLDKDIEINTLKAKLKFYDSDLNELFEYRQILSKMYSCEVKPCSDNEHEELIIFMQRQLQSYQQAVEDRNNQIMNLNLVNKELQEKIEEMIHQTRSDIQNLSQKYSLPQLETMSNELKNAEVTINSLRQQLLEKEQTDKSTQVLKEELKKAEEDKQKLLIQLDEFKKIIEENDRVKTQIQKICLKLGLSETDLLESDVDVHEVNTVKSKYGKVHEQLQQILAHLEATSPRRTNFGIIHKMKKDVQNFLNSFHLDKLESKQIREKLELWDNMLSDFIESFTHGGGSKNDFELKDTIDELTNAKTMLEGEKFALEYELKRSSNEIAEMKKEIASLIENRNNLIKESVDNGHTIQKLKDEILNYKKCMQIMEQNKLEVERQLDNTQKQLNDAKQETIDLQKEANGANEDVVRKKLFKELEDVENGLEQDKRNSDIITSELFQKCLQAQILKTELLLREQLQEDNLKKMEKIEEEYKKVIQQRSDLYHKEKEKWKIQEANYRKQFAAVLEECGRKMETLEKENIDLAKRVHILVQECKSYKSSSITVLEKYNKLAANYKKSFEDLNKRWASLLEAYMFNATKIEKQTNKNVKNIMKKMVLNDREIQLIENIYKEKMKKFLAEKHNKF
ncbi:intracellular protein transport protein USO1-like [Tribolium madens]|uniref:intracellular protein transport protein USO1-like n=1 Tax=Tribolium madens TaxID=41895 RepID=UPI001CF7584E|nr:intracellular protein transport protein USO1-like [Tribolium madens]